MGGYCSRQYTADPAYLFIITDGLCLATTGFFCFPPTCLYCYVAVLRSLSRIFPISLLPHYQNCSHIGIHAVASAPS